MKYRILVLFVSIWVLLSCTKDESANQFHQYVKIDAALYPLLFDTGSYWIYENEENKIIDSVSLINVNQYYLPSVALGQGNSISLQEYNLKFSSSVSGINDEQLVLNVISKGSISGGYLYLGSRHVGHSAQNVHVEAAYDSLIIEGNSYYNVIKMECRRDNYLSEDLNLYYADSIGLIKKVIFDGELISETWNLLRFKTYLLEVD